MVFLRLKSERNHARAATTPATMNFHRAAAPAAKNLKSAARMPVFAAAAAALTDEEATHLHYAAALADQQLGGLIMWIPGGTIYLVVALWVLAGWLRTHAQVPRAAAPDP